MDEEGEQPVSMETEKNESSDKEEASIESGRKRSTSETDTKDDPPAKRSKQEEDDTSQDSQLSELSVKSESSSDQASASLDEVLDLCSKPVKTDVDEDAPIALVKEKPEVTEEADANVSGDSDKENVDVPMDLSKTQVKKSESIIEDAAEISPEDAESKNQLIKMLKNELRNEEAKLVLLKKIRQSQLVQQMKQDTGHHQSGTALQQPRNKTGSGGQAPQLTRESNSSSSSGRQHMAPSHQHSRHGPPQLQRVPNSQNQQVAHAGHSSRNGPPPLLNMSRQHASSPVQQNSHGHSSRSSSNSQLQQQRGGPPHLPPGYQPRSQSGSQSSQQSAQPEQTPAQRQAAAKLALRKQLEKTLLQIPPPKPPAPEMNFIPSLLGADFMMLVGLEEVVKVIVETDRSREVRPPEVKYVFNPFVCVQCGSDFTPVWKRDKPGSKNVICEQCVTSNQKKALKQEHTNRLKSAFVKALQQEQEIEQRMQSVTTNSSHQSSSSHQSASAASSHSSSPMNLSTSGSTSRGPSADQLRSHQNLVQAHQAQLGRSPVPNLPSLGAFNPRAAAGLMFPFQQLPGAGAKTSAELQRQYLLDMIPRSGSNIPLWRT